MKYTYYKCGVILYRISDTGILEFYNYYNEWSDLKLDNISVASLKKDEIDEEEAFLEIL